MSILQLDLSGTNLTLEFGAPQVGITAIEYDTDTGEITFTMSTGQQFATGDIRPPAGSVAVSTDPGQLIEQRPDGLYVTGPRLASSQW